MRIGTKLAVYLVCAAVIPLAAASAVFLHTSKNVGREVAAEGATILSERVTADMKRAIESAAVSLADNRDNSLHAARLFASEVADRLSQAAPAVARAAAEPNEFLIDAPAGPGTQIDLDRIAVHVAPDAERDQIAGTLAKLAGLSDLARTLYMRNRSRVRHFQIALDDGLTLSYPAGAVAAAGDPRETPWYLRTLETGLPAWTGPDADAPDTMIAAAPVQFSDGRFAGVAVLSLRLNVMLQRALSPANLSGDMSAYLIKVPLDDPQFLPHEVATLTPGAGGWKMDDVLLPMPPDGDDQWAKVLSDIRTGVNGVETVSRGPKREVWAFGPILATTDGQLAAAVVAPAAIFENAAADATAFVDDAFSSQLQIAVGFAVLVAAAAALGGILTARSLTQPIRSLHEAARELAAGDFSVRVSETGRDELGALMRGFNRMVPALEDRLKQERDLNIAREIQQHLVPNAAPSVAGFDIAGISEYSDETGGDYLDYIGLPNGVTGAVIGDATGHGVGSALLMATARAALRANARTHPDLALLLDETNRQLAGDSAGGRFVTLLLLALSPDRDDVNWVSAGQDPALLYDPGADTFERLEGDGIPLGVDADWIYATKTATLIPGRVLVAVTDGVREAKRADGTAYGGERLRAAVRAVSGRGADTICRHVLDDVRTFLDGAPFEDDVSILVIRRTA